jgi:hypothetical protein
MKKTKGILAAIITLLFLAALSSCGGGGSFEDPGTTEYMSGGGTDPGGFNGGGGGFGGGKGGTFTITDIPSEYNGRYIIPYAVGDPFLVGMGSSPSTFAKISNGTAKMTMYEVTADSKLRGYTGNDNYTYVLVWTGKELPDESTQFTAPSMFDDGVTFFLSVTFSNGSATRTWSEW